MLASAGLRLHISSSPAIVFAEAIIQLSVFRLRSRDALITAFT